MSVIVVTGAAQGMGRSCVDRLRDQADHVLAVDLEAPDIDGVEGLACDVSDAAAVRDYYRREYGRDSEIIPYGATPPGDRGTETLQELQLNPGKYVLFVGRLEKKFGTK